MLQRQSSRASNQYDPQRLPRSPLRRQQPGPTRTDRGVRRRLRHRRRQGSTYRHSRNRRGLNPIHVNPTSTTSTRRAPRHHANHGPAHHPERGRSHIRILVNPNDAIVVILSDGQHASPSPGSRSICAQSGGHHTGPGRCPRECPPRGGVWVGCAARPLSSPPDQASNSLPCNVFAVGYAFAVVSRNLPVRSATTSAASSSTK